MALSREAANWLYDAANLGLIVSAVVVAICTFLSIWSGNERERYGASDISAAAERASLADAAAATANERAAILNERAARLEAEAARARLEAEMMRSEMRWRSLTDQERAALAASLSGKRVAVFIRPVAESREAEEYAKQLVAALIEAGCSASLGSLVPSINPPGLSIAGPDGAEKYALFAAFKSAGILLQVWSPPAGVRQADITALTIIVGASFKPLGR